jgi:pectate lyase
MFVAGNGASNRVTLSNNEFDGSTSWSATCDGHHYWAIYLTGSQDLITMKGNYIHHTSGRSPKVGGNTLLHAVNNYWYANSGHAFDNAAGGMVVAEGNVFQNVVVSSIPFCHQQKPAFLTQSCRRLSSAIPGSSSAARQPVPTRLARITWVTRAS